MSASGGRHARLTRHEHELGAWSRARRPPDPRLTGLLGRELLGYQHSRAEFSSWLEPPRAELTLMIDLDGSITADGQVLPDAWIGGLGDTYTLVGLGDTYGSIDLKLRPLGAYRLLGFPLSELTGQVVSLADAFGAEGPLLAERLRGVPDWDDRFDVLEEFLLRRLAQAPPIHPVVARAWRRLRETSGQVRVEALAAELGCLNRDFRDLAGTTPSDFVARQIPGGGVVGDEIPFVQD